MIFLPFFLISLLINCILCCVIIGIIIIKDDDDDDEDFQPNLNEPFRPIKGKRFPQKLDRFGKY